MAHDALIETDRYRARLANGPADLARSLALRAQVFRGDAGADDRDAFDARCQHVLIENTSSSALVCSYRLLTVNKASEIGQSYSAQFYELDHLAGYEGRLAEVGRFCVAPGMKDPDILRLAWAALTQIVDTQKIGMLFGCSSFDGTEPGAYAEAFALLSARHVAPPRWRPRVKAANVVRFASRRRGKLDLKRAAKALPPLLRTYLAMGGWVSDHAVIDRDLGTLHVFTGLEVGRVPAARARVLRGMVGP